MLLNSGNLDKIKYKTKRVSLEKADADIIITLIPVSMVDDARNAVGSGKEDFVGEEILRSAIVDEDGNPVFETYDKFTGLPHAVQFEIMNAVWEYNGLSGFDSIVKNLKTAQENDSK